jgi:hypothetical protein
LNTSLSELREGWGWDDVFNADVYLVDELEVEVLDES